MSIFWDIIAAILIFAGVCWWWVGGTGYSSLPKVNRAAEKLPAGRPKVNRGLICYGPRDVHGRASMEEHHHATFAECDRCEAGIPPPVPADKRPAACPLCHRNHFEEKCPPVPEPVDLSSMADGDRHVKLGHRVTNARTGEVIGYWPGR